MVKYLGYLMAGAVSRSGSRRFAYWLALRIADVYFALDRPARRAVMANLRRVLAEDGRRPRPGDVRRLARRTFHNFGKYLVDFFRFSRLTEDEIRALVVLEGEARVREALAQGKGLIVVTGHIGNWELGGAVLAGMGYKLNAVALRHPSAKVNDFFERHRRERGMTIIPFGHAVTALVRALKRGECVALLADRDYSRRNDFAPLFNAPACLPRGPAWLAEKTGAPIVPGFLLRQADDTFLLRFHEPIVPGAGIGREEIQRRICRVLEAEIGANPSQWFMFEGVWEGHNYGGGAAVQPDLSLPQEVKP